MMTTALTLPPGSVLWSWCHVMVSGLWVCAAAAVGAVGAPGQLPPPARHHHHHRTTGTPPLPNHPHPDPTYVGDAHPPFNWL